MKKRKFTHGGARPGAGRPTDAFKGKMLRIRVTDAEEALLKAEARKRGTSVSGLLMGPWRGKGA